MKIDQLLEKYKERLSTAIESYEFAAPSSDDEAVHAHACNLIGQFVTDLGELKTESEPVQCERLPVSQRAKIQRKLDWMSTFIAGMRVTATSCPGLCDGLDMLDVCIDEIEVITNKGAE